MSFRVSLTTGVFWLPFLSAACFVDVCQPRISPVCPHHLLLIGFFLPLVGFAWTSWSSLCQTCVNGEQITLSKSRLALMDCPHVSLSQMDYWMVTFGPSTCSCSGNKTAMLCCAYFRVCVSPERELTHIFSISSAVVLQQTIGVLVVDSRSSVSAFSSKG